MGISELTDMHISWLVNILDKIQHPELLDSEEVARDDLCELGQWINEKAVQYGDMPEYIDLKACHKELHRSASVAIGLAQKGDRSEAEKNLSVDGKCIENSKRLLDSCYRLINKIGPH